MALPGDQTQKVQDVTPAAAAVTTPQSTPTGTKKPFRKLFRWYNFPSSGIIEPSDSPASSPLKTSLRLAITSPPGHAQFVVTPRPTAISTPAKRCDTTACGPRSPPHGRPISYVWTVAKWLKGSPDHESLLGSLKGVFHGDQSIRDEPVGDLERQVEVRFEWMRVERGGKSKGRRWGRTELGSRTGIGLCLSVER